MLNDVAEHRRIHSFHNVMEILACMTHFLYCTWKNSKIFVRILKAHFFILCEVQYRVLYGLQVVFKRNCCNKMI